MTTLETGAKQTARADVHTAGWYDDPQSHHRLRYFDGDAWTDHVTHYGPTPCIRCVRPAGE